MNGDGKNVVVFQQRRNLPLGNWPAAAEVAPLTVLVGVQLLNDLRRRDDARLTNIGLSAVSSRRPSLGRWRLCESLIAAVRACFGQVPPARSAIANSRRQFAAKRLLNPGGMTGSASLSAATLSAAQRSAFRRK